jgi:hypothetical protein
MTLMYGIGPSVILSIVVFSGMMLVREEFKGIFTGLHLKKMRRLILVEKNETPFRGKNSRLFQKVFQILVFR